MSRALLILALVATALAGCGSASSISPGGSTSPADTTASGEGSLSKAAFIAKADAVCEASREKQEPLRRKLEQLAREARSEEGEQGTVTDGTRREVARTLDHIAARAEADLSRLQALGLPKEGGSQVEAIYRKIEIALAGSRAYAAALQAHEDAKAQAVAEKGNAETRDTASLAKRYGFQVCGARP